VVCGYHPATEPAAENSFYRVEIDPVQRRYTVQHVVIASQEGGQLPEGGPLQSGGPQQSGGREKTPAYANWRPIQGLGRDQDIARLDVRCAGRQVDLAVNLIDQPPVPLDGDRPFTPGQMGLFVSTWEDTGAQGYGVLFDDARFDEMGE
jgi:hypothetical protein